MSFRDWFSYPGKLEDDILRMNVDTLMKHTKILVDMVGDFNTLSGLLQQVSEQLVRQQQQIQKMETILIDHGLAKREDAKPERLQ